MAQPTPDPILLVGFDSTIVGELLAPLAAAGYPLRLGAPADAATGRWQAIVAPPQVPGLGGLELVAGRQREDGSLTPLLLVGPVEQLAGLDHRDPSVEHLARPFEPQVLVRTVQALVARRPETAPGSIVTTPRRMADPVFSVLDVARFAWTIEAEQAEQQGGRSPGESWVVAVRFDELDRYADRLGPEATAVFWRQVVEQAGLDALADESVAVGRDGDFLMLLPSVSRRRALRRLRSLSRRLAAHSFDMLGQVARFSPAIGFTPLRRSAGAADAIGQAREAARHSALHLDLEPAIFRGGKPEAPAIRPVPAWRQRLGGWRSRTLLWEQYLLTTLFGVGLPFCIYWLFGRFLFDVSHAMYVFVVAALVLTSASIWAEGLLALRRIDPPDEPARPYPPATAIIAAYLPNEAPIIEDTVRAFLRTQYPAALQVILAYNTPRDMPEIEDRLAEISREDPRFVPMRVRTSTSKAQNVNAALPYATGEFTAVFDADHHPDPPSFRRAWRWLSHGADVVQGHCLIRNGDASWVAKMIAVEFEQIYAVNHPGRARLHGFGIFGGSNGYWRTDLLRELRMHGFMLTEDIDSSLRAVVRGRRIVSDPFLVSRELAPETMAALTKQRLRWAQGWYQITAKWAFAALRSRRLTLRQKVGMFHLLAWREAFPWISMQVIPLILYWAVRAGSFAAIDWFVPLFVVTTLFTMTTGPGQIAFVYRLADPQIRGRRSWFVFYVVATTLFYGGLKNAWARIAQLKEALGETAWVVTTRSSKPKG